MPDNKLQIRNCIIDLIETEPYKLPAAADCNSPCWWSEDGFRILTSTGHPALSSGPNLKGLVRLGEITYTAWRDGGRWIESVHQELNGILLGWYHNEPAHFIPDQYQAGRQFPMTSPFIGAVISYDNGLSWDDLGLIITGGPDTLNLEERNYWFAGGNGDFSVILDRDGKYFYFLFGTYYKDVAQQGISLARLPFEYRFNPVGKVEKWYQGEWQENGLNGRVTPIIPVNSSWYSPNPDTFWGPSVHWNTYLQQYVILMNRAIDPRWKQDGIYVSITPDLSEPASWSVPQRLLETSGWYPQVIGCDETRHETERESGAEARLFVQGTSNHLLRFSWADS
jgi:hypothetical protein